MKWLAKGFGIFGACALVIAAGVVITILFIKPTGLAKTNDAGAVTSKHTLNSGLTVIPPEIGKTKSVELGSLLLALMPDLNTEIDWGWGLKTNVVWIDNGYQTEKDNSHLRTGLARVNVKGEISTVLMRERHEIGWTVTLSSDVPAKSGPQAVTISAGLKRDLICFGTLYTGCSFSVLTSLQDARINAQAVCEVERTGMRAVIYSVSAKGKQPAVLVEKTSFGSGGAATQVTLWFTGDVNSVCGAENAVS